MASSEGDDQDLTSSLFGDSAQADRIPEDLRPILLERWSKLRQQLDASRPSVASNVGESSEKSGGIDPIARVRELEEEVQSLTNQLTSKNAENENLASQLEELHSSYSLTRQKSVNLEGSNDNLTVEVNQLRRDKESLSKDLEEIREVAEKRLNSIEGLHLDCKRLTEQLAEANAAKCTALVRAEDVEAKEIALKHREARLEQERDLFEERLNALSEDLRQTHDNANETRRDLTTKLAHLEGDLNHKNEFIKNLEGHIEALVADKDLLISKNNDILDRLKDARDSKSSVEEGFRQEIRAQTKLSELYQKQAEDAESKYNETCKSIGDLQDLLKEAGDRYGQLEDHFEKEKVENKDEMKRRNEAIRALRQELSNANELIATLKQRGLTEEGIQALSPAAAAASKLIKGGLSLTQVYSQLVSCQEELLNKEDENRRLNTYLEQILMDIEQRAPALKRQRDEYERAVQTVGQMTEQIEQLRDANREDNDNVEVLKRRLESLGRDNDRMTKQNGDMSKQIAVLLREVEAARFGRTTSRMATPEEASEEALDAESAISERLVSFKNVQELQQKNIELLAVIREVTSKQEASETKLVEERTADLKRELDSVKYQLEDLSEARKRQEALVENIVVQRDMYKSMAESQDHHGQGGPMETSTPLRGQKSPGNVHSTAEVRAAKAEAALEEIKKDFDTYREEKCTHEKMISESLDKSRAELTETRSKLAKLSANEEWNTERFKIAQANNATYKKEIAFLEEKNSNLNTLVAKHEGSIHAMHAELIQSNGSLAQVTNKLKRYEFEVGNLRNTQARMEKERDILQRQSSGSAMIAENLKMVQLQLEKSESEARMRLTNQNEDLSKEIGLLRKKLEQEQDKYHKSVQSWESAQLELRSKVDTLREVETNAKTTIEDLNVNVEELRHQLKVSQEKLALVQAQADPGSSGIVDSERVVDLQSQVNAMKNEVLTLKEQLSRARQATNQYKSIADTAEKQVMESNETYRQMQATYEDLKSKSDEKEKLLNEQIANLSEAKGALESQAQQGLQAIQGGVANVQTLEITINGLRQELSGAQERAIQIGSELKNSIEVAKEVQVKYERELNLHAQTANALSALRSTVKDNDGQIVELQNAKNMAENSLKDAIEDAKATETTLRAEYESLKDQFGVVEQENQKLHEQLATTTTQMSTLQDSFSAGNAGANTSLNLSQSFSEEEAKSMDQLMEIIKFLRHEKGILTSKVEVSKAEAVRLKAQVESIQHQLNETQNALNVATEKSQSEMLPSSKYSQLLEKVQTIPALSDSNRFLREERDALKSSLEETSEKLKILQEQSAPLEEKLRNLTETEEKSSAEITALKADNLRWRQRVTQLIEKEQKINPEEMSKVQDENAVQKRKIETLSKEIQTLKTRCNEIIGRYKTLDTNFKNKDEECKKALQDLQNTKVTNQQLASRMNAMTKKTTELETVSQNLVKEKEALVVDMQKVHNEHKSLVTKHQEFNENHVKIAKELEDVKTQNVQFKKTIESFKVTNDKLKSLGRNLKSQLEESKKAVETKQAEKEVLETTLKAVNEAKAETSTSVATRSAGDSDQDQPTETDELLKESLAQITDLEGQVKKLEAEVEKINEQNKNLLTDKERVKPILQNAKSKIATLVKEKEEQKKQYENLKKETEDLSKGRVNEVVKKLRTDLLVTKNDLEKAKAEHEAEKCEFQKKIEELSKAKTEAKKSDPDDNKHSQDVQTGMVKPVVSEAKPQKAVKAQPQAQVQPTRHVVTVPQTATVRPTTTRQVQVSRQNPVASVSPSSQATNLNPSAPEFTPQTAPVAPAAATTAPMEQIETVATSSEATLTPLATVPPRQSEAEQPQPSTSSSMTASVAPTLKRSREDEAGAEDEASKRARAAEDEPQPSVQAVEDDVVVLSSSDEEDEPEEEPPAEDEEDEDMTEENDESGDEDIDDDEDPQGPVGQVVDDDVDDNDDETEEIEEDDDTGYDYGQPDQDDDAVLVVESDTDEEQGQDDQDAFMATEEIEESSNQMEDPGAVVPQMAEAPSEVRPSEVIEANVPSESVVIQAQQSGQFEDAADDSVVPSTPKLPTAESAVTPQVPTFMFQAAQAESAQASVSSSTPTFSSLAASVSASVSPSSSGVKGASQEGIDRTAVDFSQFAGTSSASSSTSAAPTGFAELAKKGPTSIFGGSASTSSAFGSAPVFGGPPTLGKPASGSASIFGATKSPTPAGAVVPTEDKPEEGGPSSSSEVEVQGQSIEVVASSSSERQRAPKISRTPIIWSSPPGASGAPAPPAAPPAAAPSASQRARGRGTARRSRPGRGAATRGTRGTPPT